jgi:hypothetical protein
MAESDMISLQAEVRQLGADHRKLRWILAMSMVVIAGLIFMGIGGVGRVVAAPADEDGVLRVRGLIVTDQNRVERLRLGAPLPDPVINGVRRKRSGAVAGMTIMDAKGNERGGFVTADQSGEAFLGLDSEDEQQVLFLANPKGGVNFNLFDSKGNGAQLTVFPDGPRFHDDESEVAGCRPPVARPLIAAIVA